MATADRWQEIRARLAKNPGVHPKMREYITHVNSSVSTWPTTTTTSTTTTTAP